MRNSYRNGGRCLAIGAALLVMTLPAVAEQHVRVQWSGDLGVGYDDNVGNAAEDGDVRDSSVVSGGVNLDYHQALTLNSGLLLRGAVQGEAYEAQDGLSNARVLAMARLSHRPTGGFHMPTFAGWFSAGAAEYNSTMRDGFDYRGGLFLVEPLTTAISTRLSVAAAERRGDNAVFDLSSWSASVNLDWAVTARSTLYMGYQFQEGDVVSTGTVPPKASHISGGGGSSGCGSASACDLDDALDGQSAYRIDARTHVTTAGLNLPLSNALALDGQVRVVDSTTEGGTGYSRLQAVVSALMRF